MAQLFYSRQAKQDLFEIGYYISERNPNAADKLISGIMSSCERLKDFPLAGPAREDLRPNIRQLTYDNYLALYRVNKDTVEILRIVHSARYLRGLL